MTTIAPNLADRPAPAPCLQRLERNLRALGARSPRAARAIAQTQPTPDIAFAIASDGSLIADHAGRALASRRRPLDEAARFAESVDLHEHAGVLVLGFGLGHHVRALAERARTSACIIVYEPDLALLRAVFERIDAAQWLAEHTVVLITEHDNAGALSQTLRGLEAPLSIGVAIAEHPASKPRLTDTAQQFLETFTGVFASMRTHVITTLMQTDVTVRNELMNAEHAIRRPGIADLEGIAAGRPAIVVSAGPSLRRNIHLLKTPGLRDRCVIIAVQTVLKQLLAEGIRPHFVTAIDYHEISRRFYEGLTPDAVAGVTLIAEARANPAILDTYPGDIRVPADDFLDLFFDTQPESRGKLQPGATVAHLSYYFARHLGADPVILVGQDLAFTDGQYYPKGAAIHEVWAPELNAFNTLEMMEWQRIVRMRGTLRRATDHLGRPVFTDEQMGAYLTQFERDFLPDTERGLTIIDATEGGVHKAHTHTMTLAEAIERHAGPAHPLLPMIPGAPPTEDAACIHAARERMRQVALDVRRIARLSRETTEIMRKIERDPRDVARVNRLIEQINETRDQVHAIQPAWTLVLRLNQLGALKRFKADRLLELEPTLDQFERLARQTQRDIQNLKWTAEYADLLAELIDIAEAAFDGGPKRTRDVPPPELDADPRIETRQRTRTGAVVLAPSTEQIVAGIPALKRTVDRLLCCEHLDELVILADHADRARAILADHADRIVIEPWKPTDGPHARRIRTARAWADTCWRAGLGGATVFDEALDAPALAPVMQRRDLQGALILRADWVCIDPALCDELAQRFAEHPEANPIVFTQAPPGLAGCIIARSLVEELASGVRDGHRHATLGAVLGYHPARALMDPIARTGCLQIDPNIRSTLHRFIPDTPAARASLESILAQCPDTADARALCAAMRAHARTHWPEAPRELILELTTDRILHGPRLRSRFNADAFPHRAPLDLHRAQSLIADFAALSPGGLLTLAGFGDPLCHPAWRDIVAIAREHDLGAIHLRTDLARDEDVDAVLGSALDVVSVDVSANSEAVYDERTDGGDFAPLLSRMQRLVESAKGEHDPAWIVPRITRCDATYSEIEHFFDAWTAITGWAVIDQRADTNSPDRIEPLGKPRIVVERDARRRMCILADVRTIADERDITPHAPIPCPDIAAAWREIVAQRRALVERESWDDPSLWTGW